MKENFGGVIRKGKKSLVALGLAGILGASSFLGGCANSRSYQIPVVSYTTFTANYYKDFNENGIAEKNEFIGKIGRASCRERV